MQHATTTASEVNDFDLDFFQLGEDDWPQLGRIMRAVERHAPAALDRFYARVGTRPETSKHFASPSAMGAAKGKQFDHWRHLFSNKPGPEYFARANTIGLVHARIGLEPRWYVGAYASIVAEVLSGLIGSSFGIALDGGRTARAASTLVKMAMLDMTVALTSYFHAEEERRQQVIEQLGSVLARMAEGDFTAELGSLPREYARIEADFAHMRERITEVLAEVATVSESIRTGGAEIQDASDDLARRTESQAATLEETAASLDVLTAGISRGAEEAAGASSAVVQSRDEAIEGATIVVEAVAAMDDIQKSASQIGKIVDVIDGIAFQTNLLALNAGVEAARAGDAGKGFAVVATEVRALAQRSADAARDIKLLIGDSTEQVSRGAALVRRSGAAFDTIVARVHEVANLVGSISERASEQSNGLTQVNGAVHQMDLVTQQNAAMVEEATAASRSLAAEATRLAELVGSFKLQGSDRPAPVATQPISLSRPRGGVRRGPASVGATALQRVSPDPIWSEF